MDNKMREAKKALDKLINGAIRNGYPSDTALELGKIVSSSISQVEQEAEPLPNEQGTNRYGLDMGYFRNLINRELNHSRGLYDYKPSELARVFSRMAAAADRSVLQEPEFHPQPATIPEGFSDLLIKALKAHRRYYQSMNVHPQNYIRAVASTIQEFWVDEANDCDRDPIAILSAAPSQVEEEWRSMDTAPYDCTLVQLLIPKEQFPYCFDAEEDGNFSRAIGLSSTKEDGAVGWMVVGWDWDNDTFTDVEREVVNPVAWQPLAKIFTGLKRPQPPKGEE